MAGKSRRVGPAPRRRARAAPKKRRTSSKRRPAKRRSLWRWMFAPVRWLALILWKLFVRGSVVAVLLVGLAVAYVFSTLPPLTTLLDGRARGSVTMLDRDGQVFAWRGEQFGGIITTDTVSPHLKNAVVATEDKRFYRHLGISPRGIASAVRINLSEGRGPLSGHGGSTITQQTAKLLCLGVVYDQNVWESEAAYESDCRQSTMWRKAKEAIFALAMEVKYTKAEILTIYMNRAFLGAGARGFEAAAQRYFGMSAAEVDAAEAAMLAGLLKAPTRYAPTNNLQRSQDRALTVLKLMQEQGYLTKAEADRARAMPAELSAAAEARAGGYFADWVMDQGPAFLTRDTTEDVVIRTTFDPAIQRAAEAALQFVFDNKVRAGSKAQAAIVVMSSDGAVRAMVGGRRFKGVAGQFNRAIMAKRQTGSSFKPFVYATALELGYGPLDTVVDEPITITVPGSDPWSPKNYDKKFHGRVTLTEALAESYNVPAVRVSEFVGRENVRTVAEDFGIDSNLALGPALALGASESTLLEMSGAYAGILNGGTSVEPYGLIELRLQGDDAPLIGQDGGLGERVISTQAARQLVWMMHQVVETGTAQRAKLPDRQSGGKTGTTQAARDAWFLGFTADYVAGVWMGYDDNTPLTGVTGGGLPAEIWRETMERVNRGIPARPLPMEAPAAPRQSGVSSTAASPAPEPVPRQQRQPGRGGDVAERILLEVLNDILRGN